MPCHPQKNNQTVRFDYSRFIVLFSIHMPGPTKKKLNDAFYLFPFLYVLSIAVIVASSIR
jgi:hypothetical protein